MSTGLRETLQRIIGKRQVSLSLLGHFERIERERDDCRAILARITAENPTCLGHVPDDPSVNPQVCVRCLQPYPCEVRRLWILLDEAQRKLAPDTSTDTSDSRT
jgi:hypothetical protein